MTQRIIMLVLCGLASYFVGTFNPSYFVSKIKGFDIREAGSGNAGGSNALITMGKRIGAICMILDIIKAFVVVSLSSKVFLPDEPLAVPVSTTFVILGHMYPFYMGFKGGKGLACLGGSLLAYSPLIAMIFLAIELVLVFVVDYIVVVPLTVSVAFPIVYYFRGGEVSGVLIMLIAVVAMLHKHRENLSRIKAGKEVRFSFLWKRDKEIERVRQNHSEEEFNNIQIKKNS